MENSIVAYGNVLINPIPIPNPNTNRGLSVRYQNRPLILNIRESMNIDIEDNNKKQPGDTQHERRTSDQTNTPESGSYNFKEYMQP